MPRSQITELIVIRHAETRWNSNRIIQGQLDIKLSRRGREQATKLATRLAGESFHALYTSDLKRASHTARTIARATGHTVQQDSRLRERNMGVLQGMSWEEVKTRLPEVIAQIKLHDPERTIPQGESTNQVFERVGSWLDEIIQRHNAQRVVAITHGGILNVLFRLLLELPKARFSRLKLPNAGINRFIREEGRWYLLAWGDVCHLK